MPYETLELNIKSPENLTQEDQQQDTFEDDVEIIEEDDEDTFMSDALSAEYEEEEDVEDSDLTEEDEEEEDEGDVEEEDQSGDTDEEIQDVNKDEDRKSRANTRIRQLVSRTKDLETQLNSKDDRIHELENKLIELQKDTVETGKSFLGRHKKAITEQLQKAMDEGDTAKMLDLQEELRQVSNHLDAYESWQAPEAPKKETSNKEKQELAPAFQEWLSANPWFQNPQTAEDHEKVALADAYSALLMKQKGYTLEEYELFDELDEKISGKKVATPKKDVVQSRKSSETDRRKTPKKVSQRVQGASRTPASTTSRRKKIQLTQTEKDIADAMNISYREYADEKLRLEKSSNNGIGNMRTLK